MNAVLANTHFIFSGGFCIKKICQNAIVLKGRRNITLVDIVMYGKERMSDFNLPAFLSPLASRQVD